MFLEFLPDTWSAFPSLPTQESSEVCAGRVLTSQMNPGSLGSGGRVPTQACLTARTCQVPPQESSVGPGLRERKWCSWESGPGPPVDNKHFMQSETVFAYAHEPTSF